MKLKSTICLSSTIEAIKAGDIHAFESLYQVFGPKLYSFALLLIRQREEAEEVVQEVFLKMWERRLQLDADQNIEGYLFSIAKNMIYNKARRKVYEAALIQYSTEHDIKAGWYTEETIDFHDLTRLLEDTYARMPPARRQVFIMSRLEGKSNREIAEHLETSISNVENHLHKALKVIKDRFRRYGLLCLVGLLYCLAAIL